MKNLLYVVLTGALFVALFTGCETMLEEDSFRTNRYSAESSFSLSVETQDMDQLKVNGINGPVTISGHSEDDHVIIKGTKTVRSKNQADADAFLKNIRVNLEEAGTRLNIYSEQPEELRGRNVTIEYDIRVPYNWSTMIDVANGACSLDSLNGRVSVRVTNGNVDLSSINANAAVKVTNGQINGTVILPVNGQLSAETVNGLVRLALPQNTSAAFSATVTNGTVNVSGLVLNNQRVSATSVYGTIGDGNGCIELKTTNGNIDVSGF